MNRNYIILIILFFTTSTNAFNADFNLLSTTPGTQSIITSTLDCSPDQNNYIAGDLIDYQLFYCADYNCTTYRTGNTLIDNNCAETYQDVINIPNEYFRISFTSAAKLHTDQNYGTYGFVMYEKRFKQTPSPETPGIGETIPQTLVLGWLSYAGILTFFIGLILLLLRKWWGILPLIIGIILFVTGLLYHF